MWELPGQTKPLENPGPVGQVLVAIGAALLIAAAVVQVVHERDLASEPGRATGTVVGFVEHSGAKGYRSYTSVIQFTTSNGQVVQFGWGVANLLGQPDDVGQETPVAYDPADPSRATVDTTFSWYLTFLLGGVGGLVVVGGLLAMKYTPSQQTTQDLAA